MLGFTGILLRTSTERPEVLDKGSIVIGGITGKDVEQAIELAAAMRNDKEEQLLPPDYMDSNASAKVVKIIQSYTKLINRFIWYK